MQKSVLPKRGRFLISYQLQWRFYSSLIICIPFDQCNWSKKPPLRQLKNYYLSVSRKLTLQVKWVTSNSTIQPEFLIKLTEALQSSSIEHDHVSSVESIYCTGFYSGKRTGLGGKSKLSISSSSISTTLFIGRRSIGFISMHHNATMIIFFAIVYSSSAASPISNLSSTICL